MSLVDVDGHALRERWEDEADIVIVGSGPGGSAAAAVLAQAGLTVRLLEAGRQHTAANMPPDAWTAMARSYHGMGGTLTLGRAPMPYVLGVAVGGGTVINGAISWRLPRDVHHSWLAADPGLRQVLAWSELERVTDAIEKRLSITPTDPSVAGRNNRLLREGAEAMGLEHRPISRNVVGCRGSARCLQGCPHSAKQSMDITLLSDATADGARIASGVRVDRVLLQDGRAVGVTGRARGGGRVTVRARQAVLLAAGAVGTPVLLLASGLRRPPVGRHLAAHPGAGVLGRYDDPVRSWQGATQGHEVIGLRRQGLKFETLGLDRGVLTSRLPGLGRALASERDHADHYASWGVALKARSTGSVRRLPVLGTTVRLGLGRDDVRTLRRGVATLCRLHFAAGATEVLPGVRGLPDRLTHPRELDALEADGPDDPAAYSLVMTHLFGTARMGTDPATSVVSCTGEHHDVARLYVSDASLFPSNTGVNPATSILAVCTRIAEGLAQRLGRHGPSR